MSFLAQLRQQPTAEQGYKLCYLLCIEQPAQRASLTLGLARLHQGQLVHLGKPYLIQLQHLQRPPSFLDAVDISLLQTLINDSANWLQHSSGNLPESDNGEFLQGLIHSQRCFIETGPTIRVPVKAGPEQAVELYWAINDTGEQQLRWRSQAEAALFCVGHSPFVYTISAQACTLSAGTSTLSREAIRAAISGGQALSVQAIAPFLAQYQTRWQQWRLPLPRDLPHREVATTITPVLHCYSSSTTDRDIIQLKFRYSSEQYCVTLTANAQDNSLLQYWDGTAIVCLSRQPEQEHFFQQQLAPLLFQLDALDQPNAIYQWQSASKKVWQALLTETRSHLEALGFQFLMAANFRHHYVVADSWQVHIDAHDGGNVSQLSLQLSVADTVINLRDLLAQLQHFNREQSGADQACLTLPDGRLLLLPVAQLTGIMENLGDWFGHTGREFHIPDNQLYRLHTLQQQLPGNTQWQGDIGLLDQAIKLHQTPTLLDSTLSAVKAQLRPYQWLGVCWLQHLKQHQVNGLLADDMGLGKTLQALAHLSLEQQQGALKQPALIVAPTSLLHNWAAEIKRFTPHLRHQIIHGPQRHQHWAQLNQYDIVISSYALISNDLAYWQQQPLSWIILDEAQTIKNPRTLVSQALRQLNSDHRLCLSGTPVENHLGELWSLLDFLMPNCLGSRTAFKHTYQKPIEQDGNTDRLQQLLQRIAPFMLRRNKDQVAQDLPAKTEIYQTISLNDDQQTFYQQIKSTGWLELQQQLPDSDNSGQQQILLLTALLKLRQACCDPQLLGEHAVSSAKREHCIAMIRELVAEHRAILIFSQFTGMLDLLAADLQQQQIDYLMLTGQTRNRQQVVEAFQQGQAPVFLISLKAGGVGLNLTRADTVIHYDPWWNSAAEQQATDRAHRIGQDKPVFVYKLIAENTIEEKIAELQQRKALLSQHINHQAQASGKDFALKLEDLLALWQQESPAPC